LLRKSGSVIACDVEASAAWAPATRGVWLERAHSTKADQLELERLVFLHLDGLLMIWE